MAHLFNIYFKLDDVQYTAIVSVKQTPFYTEYTLANLHENVLEQLPGNKIIASSSGEFRFPHVEMLNTPATEIIRAVSGHIRSLQLV